MGNEPLRDWLYEIITPIEGDTFYFTTSARWAKTEVGVVQSNVVVRFLIDRVAADRIKIVHADVPGLGLGVCSWAWSDDAGAALDSLVEV